MLHGIAYNVEVEGFKVLEELGGGRPTTVATTGGGGKNRRWREIRGEAFRKWMGVKGVVKEGGGEGGGDEASMGAALIGIRAEIRDNEGQHNE